ncbi:hypothetical protein ACXJJ3_32760 [Kribbella sp. WER1]
MPPKSRMFASAQRPLPEAPKTGEIPSYIWYGADLVTGNIIEELPFVPGGPISRVIGAYTSLQGTLALPDSPAGWEAATEPGRVMLVCVRAEDEMPLWGGIVIGRSGGTNFTIELSLVSIEGYFDRRFVKARDNEQRNASGIALNLVFDIPESIGLTWLAYTSDLTLDREYTDTSDQTVYSQLTELMGLQGGPEWTVDILWKNANHTAFDKRFHVEQTIGRGSWDNPEAVFDFPGNVVEYTLSEDFTSDKGANHIEYFGDGEGDTRPAGVPARATDLLAAGWPRYEFRRTIAGADEDDDLTKHAAEALTWMKQGARIVTLVGRASEAPRLEVAWSLGSPVKLEVSESPRHPNGYSLTARAIGWELDTLDGTVTPMLEEQELDE